MWIWILNHQALPYSHFAPTLESTFSKIYSMTELQPMGIFNIYLFIYLAVLGLSCGKQTLSFTWALVL